MLEVAAFINPKHIYFLGDYADFYAVSSHGKHPQMAQLLIDEVCDVLMGFEEIDKMFPEARKVFIEGNHEFRLERYISNNSPALFGVTSTEDILQLRDRPNWQFIPYGPNQMVKIAGSKLFARHESLAPTAKGTAAKALCSLVYGHIHRIESSHIVGLDGSDHVAFSVGWLGDKRKDKVFGYLKNHAQWQLGFGIVYVDPSNGLFYPMSVHIVESGSKVSCVVNGRRFTA